MKIKARIKSQTLIDKFPIGTVVYITNSEFDAFDRVWYYTEDSTDPSRTDVVYPSTLEILYKTQRNLMTLKLHLLLDKLENEY